MIMRRTLSLIALAVALPFMSHGETLNCEEYDFGETVSDVVDQYQNFKDTWDFLDLAPTITVPSFEATGTICDCCEDGVFTEDNYYSGTISTEITASGSIPNPLGRQLHFNEKTISIPLTTQAVVVDIEGQIGLNGNVSVTGTPSGTLSKECDGEICYNVSGSVSGSFTATAGGEVTLTVDDDDPDEPDNYFTGNIELTLEAVVPAKGNVAYDSCDGGFSGDACIEPIVGTGTAAVTVSLVGGWLEGNFSVSHEEELWEGNCPAS